MSISQRPQLWKSSPSNQGNRMEPFRVFFIVWMLSVAGSIIYAFVNYSGNCGGISVMGGRFDCNFFQFYLGLDNLYFWLINLFLAIVLGVWFIIRLIRKTHGN